MEPTTFFEHYRIGTGEAGREVSRTGAAINYKAIDTRSHEPVRLQLIPLATIEPEKLAQLKERAETAEKLDHVNIARTFAVGVEHDYFAIVSEHFEGETADSWIVANGPMPADAALRVGLQVVRAIGAAAFFNLTHRAIQPSNLRFSIGNVFARRDDVFSAHWRSAAGGQRNESPLADPAFAGTAARAQTAAQFAGLPIARESGESPARSGRVREGNAGLPDEDRTAPGARTKTGTFVGGSCAAKSKAAERASASARAGAARLRGGGGSTSGGGSGGRIFLSG